MSDNRTQQHTKDSDCTVDPQTLCCTVCGVDHSEPCLECGGRGYHKEACPTLNSTQPKHTPGPWQYQQSDPRDFIVVEPTGRTICEPNDPLYYPLARKGERVISVEEAQANAKLIAAAPEMVETLKDALTRLQGMTTEQFSLGGDKAIREQIERVIAKAEGR